MRMETSDDELARTAAAGDREAFAVLLDRHYDRVFRIAFRLTGRADLAEDLTQDVCVALPGKMSGFRGDASFTTWLYRVVFNAAQDFRRRSESHQRAISSWGDVERMRRDEVAETSAQLEWLQAAMSALSPDLRATLALTMEEGMTHAEAAQVLGVSEGTISWRLSQVRNALRAISEQELEE